VDLNNGGQESFQCSGTYETAYEVNADCISDDTPRRYVEFFVVSTGLPLES
jgi:hypothetical protein